MTKKIRIKLPQNCYTREYLEQSGIHCEYSILDTAYVNGPSRFFYMWCVLLLVPLVLMGIDHCWLHINSRFMNYLLGLLSAVSLLVSLCLLIKHFILLKIRANVRRNMPIAVEPVAIMLLPSRNDLLDRVNFSYSKTAVVYKECGTRKPRFYLGAVRTGMINTLPSKTALLYRHHSLARYFSVDSEFELKKTLDYVQERNTRNQVATV